MHRRKHGHSSPVVSRLCRGTLTFGAEAGEATSHRMMDDYFAVGGAQQRVCKIEGGR